MSAGPSRYVVAVGRQSQWIHHYGACMSKRRAISSSAALATTMTTRPETQHQFQTQPTTKSPRTKPNRQTAKARVNTSQLPPQHTKAKDKRTLISLQVAISAQDVEEAWKAWPQACESGQIYHLGTEEALSLVELIMESNDGIDRLHLMYEGLFQGSKWKALSKCMNLQLEANQHESLLKTAAKVVSPWKASETGTVERGLVPLSLIQEAVILCAVSCSRQTVPNVLPLIQLVRPLVPRWINHAGAFGQKREAGFHSNGSGMTMLGTISVLQNLFTDAAAARIPFTFCRHGILAWGLDFKDPERISNEAGTNMAKRIRNLFLSNEVESVKMLLETAMEARKDEYGSWFEMTSRHDVRADWDDTAWNAILSGSISKGNKKLAEEAWMAYETVKSSSKEPPTPRIWNSLITGYTACGQWMSVQSAWNQMKAYGTKPDIISYTTMISAMFRAKEANQALLIFEDAKQSVAAGEMQWTPPLFSALTHGLLLTGRSKEATQILQDMINGRGGLPKPGLSTINIFMRSYAQNDDFDSMIGMLKLISDLGLDPDKYTHGTLMDAFTSAGNHEAVLQIFGSMKKEGGSNFDGGTLGVLIRSMLTEDDKYGVDFATALDILSKMEAIGPPPTTITYTIIIDALLEYRHDFEQLCKKDQLRYPYNTYVTTLTATTQDNEHFSPSMQFALGLFSRIYRRGLRPNRVTYHYLISALLDRTDNYKISSKEPRLEYQEKAMQLLQDCLAESPGPNAQTWIIVLPGLIANSRRIDAELASKARKYMADTVKEISKSEHHSTFGPLIKVLEEARAILSRS